jgi:drug/metabolite transporter (DMT)-like permease
MGSCSFVKAVGSCLALQYISPTRFAIFQPSVPCIATVISIAIEIEKFSYVKALGIALAVIGAMTVVLSKPHSNIHEKDVLLGIIIVLFFNG